MGEVLSWDEWLALDLGTPDWLIPEILERGGGGLLHGGSRSFKSFWLLRLCLDLASQFPVMDIWPIPKPYRTLMLQAEGSKRAWRDRMVALRDSYPASIPFWSKHTLTEKLDTRAGQSMMAEALALVKPDLVVVDPIAFFFTGSDSDPVQVQKWLDTVNVWREATGTAVILCHHDRQAIRFPTRSGFQTLDAGMDEARGSTRLPAWADFVGQMRRVGDLTTLIVQKVRDAQDGQEFTFELKAGKMVLTERTTDLQKLILDVLRPGPLFGAEVVRLVRKDTAFVDRTIRRTIERLISAGKIQRVSRGGKIQLELVEA